MNWDIYKTKDYFVLTKCPGCTLPLGPLSEAIDIFSHDL